MKKHILTVFLIVGGCIDAAAPSNASLSDVMNDPLGLVATACRDLKATAQGYRNSTKNRAFSTENNNDECPLCFDRLCDTQLPCPGTIKHRFCKQCIDTTFKTDPQQRCPLCRQSTLQLKHVRDHHFNFDGIAPHFHEEIQTFVNNLTDQDYTLLAHRCSINNSRIEEEVFNNVLWTDSHLSQEERMTHFRNSLGITDDPIAVPDLAELTRRYIQRMQKNQHYLRDQLPHNRKHSTTAKHHPFMFDNIHAYVAPALRPQVIDFIKNLSDTEYKKLMDTYGHAAEVEVSEHEEWLNPAINEQMRKNLFRRHIGLSTRTLAQRLSQQIIDKNLIRFIKNDFARKVAQEDMTTENAERTIKAVEELLAAARYLYPE